MANKNLSQAKNAKNDEFYTQYADIQAEVNAYLDYNPDTFRDKTVLLPCDDPEWSNFTRFFAQNFQRFGLKKLISTSFAADSKNFKTVYQPTLFEEESPQFDKKKTKVRGKIFVLDHDANKNGKIDIEDLEWKYLEGDGDFRSEEVKRLRDEADIIVTNPPFSLFREFLAWILEGDSNRVERVDRVEVRGEDFGRKESVDGIVFDKINKIDRIENPDNPVNPVKKNLHVSTRSARLNENAEKKFLILGNKSAVTYKEVFPLIKENKLWSGRTEWAGGMWFETKNSDDVDRVVDGVNMKNVASVWFTNLEHGRRHQPLQLMTMADNIKFSRHKDFRGKEYQKYDNYDAIEVPFTDAIPSDYDGVMGVPISFLDKYCPEQFEILGITKTWFGAASKIYPEQIEVNKKGEQKRVTKLNDGATLKLDAPPTGETHYIVDGNVYIQLYARILIRHRKDKL